MFLPDGSLCGSSPSPTISSSPSLVTYIVSLVPVSTYSQSRGVLSSTFPSFGLGGHRLLAQHLGKEGVS